MEFCGSGIGTLRLIISSNYNIQTLIKVINYVPCIRNVGLPHAIVNTWISLFLELTTKSQVNMQLYLYVKEVTKVMQRSHCIEI